MEEPIQQEQSSTAASAESLDPESIVQEILSSLASEEDWDVSKEPNNGKDGGQPLPLSTHIWRTLVPSESKTEQTTVSTNAWTLGISRLANLLPQMISPLEVHNVAMQAIVFTEGCITHVQLCILLSVYALRQLPTVSGTTWKRCQSLVFETIRLYQRYGQYLQPFLWMDHVVPACLLVHQQILASQRDALHVALQSALIGTTTRIMAAVARQQQQDESEEEEEEEEEEERTTSKDQHQQQQTKQYRVLHQLYECLAITILQDRCELVFGHPWRIYAERTVPRYLNEDLECLARRHDLTWWSLHAYRVEAVAGVDTSWGEEDSRDDGDSSINIGVVLFAMAALQDMRPYSSDYIWRMFFPHAIRLRDQPALLESYLDRLLPMIPNGSQTWHGRDSSKKPDSPIHLFEHLFHLLPRSPNPPRLMRYVKELLGKYQPIPQVKLVRKLLLHSAVEEIKPKLLDFLQPVVYEPDAADALWSFVQQSLVKELFKHVTKSDNRKNRDPEEEAKYQLCDVETLRDKVELYVAAVTLIQRYYMRHSEFPRRIKLQQLDIFYATLTSTLAAWLSDSYNGMPPEDFFRLYLLEGALKQLLDLKKRGDLNSSTNVTPDTGSSDAEGSDTLSVEEPAMA